MAANIQFATQYENHNECIILPLENGDAKGLQTVLPDDVFKRVNELCNDDENGFDGKTGSIVHFGGQQQGHFTCYVLLGLGKDVTAVEAETAGGKLYSHLKGLKIQSATLIGFENGLIAAAIANGFYLRSYSFNEYKTKDREKLDKSIKLTVVSSDKSKDEKEFKAMKNVSDAVFLARNFVNQPPNVLYPESYADMIKKEFKGTNVKITILDDRKLERMGAGAILAVGKGSERKPRMVVLEYDGRDKKSQEDRPLALVGKGVTFDTGGYSLKPRDAIQNMKMDMGGSAAVVGAFKALAANKVKKHVVGIVALAENMIAGNAYRVDDIVTSLSGQTIEVMNTDAEGRLCLADALTYIQDKYNPQSVVDAATLTGACMAALGLEIAGVFSNSKEIETSFWESGKLTGEDFWPLPVNDAFDKQIDSQVADMKNLGSTPYAGASTAAVFLQRFITDGRPWAHLDIAGTAWRKDDGPICPKGGTGFGVRSFYHWVINT